MSWISKLAEQVNVPFPPEGEGWLTLSEVAAQIGCGQTKAITALSKANAERRRYMHIGSDGRKVVLTHYRCQL